jgi:hypothetical protein
MAVDLPDLGAEFSSTGLNDGNTAHAEATKGVIHVAPGAYLLRRRGITAAPDRNDSYENIVIKEFVAPEASVDRTYVVHQPYLEATDGTGLRLSATVLSPGAIKEVRLTVFPPKAPGSIPEGDGVAGGQPGRGNGPGPRHAENGNSKIPSELITRGNLRYFISVRGPDGFESFPSLSPGLPTEWDFIGAPWVTRVVPASAPVLIFEAASNISQVTADKRDQNYEIVPSDRPGTAAMAVTTQDLNGAEKDYSFRFYFKEKIAGRISDFRTKSRIVVYGRSGTDKPQQTQIALVTSDGASFGASIVLGPRFEAHSVPVSSLHKVPSPNIPHGYPVFIKFWSPTDPKSSLDLGTAEAVLVSMGPGLGAGELAGPHSLEIERIWME